MLITAVKGALAHKARLALTGVAILLGVAFVSGTLVFTDTIQARFETLFADVYEGTDASVRATAPEFGAGVTTAAQAIPAALVDQVRAVDGVARAEGYLEGFGQVIDAQGDPVGGLGPPTYAYSWIEDEELNPFRIADGNGRAPAEPGEAVVDVATAERAGLAVGDRVTVQFASGAEEFDLVGIVSFGDSNNLAGATIAVVTLADAQRILGMADQVTYIDVVGGDGVAQADLVARIQAVLPAGVEAVSGDQLTANAIAGFTDGLGFLSIALLAFAAVAVLVGAFIIANTFRIIVTQRTRELALLRAIGASSRQVVGIVLAEALVVAVLASALGVLAGVGVAQLIKAGMGAVGFGPPEGPLTIEPRTVVAGLLVGIVVTLLAALLPALRAARVPPVAALQAGAWARREPPARLWLRGGLLVLGLGAVAAGLAGGLGVLTAAGCLLAFVAVLLLAPSLTRPVAGTVGRPLPGAVGQLARENAGRDPRRTAATASALTVGMALVVFTAIFAASAKDSIAAEVAQSFPAGLRVQSSNPYLGIAPAAVAAVTAAPDVSVASALWTGPARVAGADAAVTAFDGATIDGVLDAGSQTPLSGLGAGLLVHRDVLADQGLALGDTVPVAFPSGRSAGLVIVGTHASTVLGAYALDRTTWQRLGGGPDASVLLVGLAPGVDPAAGKEAVASALADFPSLAVTTTSDQVAAAVAQVDALLVLFTALLGMALLIAVLGIANTLALSIVERTREIGLLRAVGMSRRQVRWMISSEAVLTALFGALLGTAIGLGLGWVVVTALGAQGLSSFTVPVAQLTAWLLLAALAGVVAAALPARKAARLDLLRAIAYE